jgi:hypothetical protein
MRWLVAAVCGGWIVAAILGLVLVIGAIVWWRREHHRPQAPPA